MESDTAARLEESISNLQKLGDSGFCRHHSRAFNSLLEECRGAAAEGSLETAERIEHITECLRDHDDACNSLISEVLDRKSVV